jgi:diguanylate cyclase (GGDEF)-like protein/PAS domain S-box-containing protein
MGEHMPAAQSRGPEGDACGGEPGGQVDSPVRLAARYRAILEHSPTAIITLDAGGVILEVGRAASELIGVPEEQLVGARIRELMGSELHPLLDQALRGEPVTYEGLGCPAPDDGDIWLRARWVPVRGKDGALLGGVALIHDASTEKRAQDLAEKLAFIDPVTDLPNRTMLAMMLSRALSGAKAAKRQLALVWLNLDRFKDVNDALGRESGDRLLRSVGERLQEHVRASDMVARVGEDDFLLLLPRINSRRHLERLMGRVHEVFAAPFIVGSESVLLSASCGIAVNPNGGSDAHQLQEHAHTAMRSAKQLGGGACEVYEADLAGDAGHRLHLVREIREGIEKDQFVLHYQPQIHLQSMRVQALEALVRWEHPERGLLAPGEFIGFAEETAAIVPLGRHILERACEHHKGWHQSLEAPPRLAINVSAREFQRADVCGQVCEVAEAAGLSPSALEIEITETAVLADPKHAAEVATCLRDVGASIALDDFGTGYSSLTHLRELPIDRVKIDRTFVANCLTDRSASAILVGITHIAHDLGMEVVAEGVETEAQLDFVRAVGCDAAQGFHLARPLPHAECTEYLLRAAEGPVM